MGRNLAITLGLAGLVLAAVTLTLFATRCDAPTIPLLVGYAAGWLLMVIAVIGGLRPIPVFVVVIVVSAAVLAVAFGYLAFLAAFARCFEF
ncbi:MAG: hypothetical protein HOY71_12390 [Nonomuraea sp.]|nr:hypothetical protein [Nonomuraea sp.]